MVSEFTGRQVNQNRASLMTVFDSPSQAIACAKSIQHELKALKKNKVEIRMGINSGEPITEHNGLFEDAIQLTGWLCDIAADGQISISTQVMERTKGMFSKIQDKKNVFKVVSPVDERFLNIFMRAIQPALCNEVITIESLSKAIGVSRAQLYRKITSLTGHSPNNFIHELKLKKSLRLVLQKYGNIAEIAFASGFNNPSYFTKSFQKRFRSLPAQVLRSI